MLKKSLRRSAFPLRWQAGASHPGLARSAGKGSTGPFALLRLAHGLFRRAPSALLCLALSLTAPAAQALTAAEDQPTQIQADRIEANQQTGVITYRGHVSFVKGGMSILADKIEVRQRGEALHSVTATGAPVRFSQRGPGPRDEIRGVAARVDYRADKREVALHGKVRLEQHGDVLEAATVYYQLDGGGFRAEGGAEGQVQSVLAPRRRGQTGSAP